MNKVNAQSLHQMLINLKQKNIILQDITVFDENKTFIREIKVTEDYVKENFQKCLEQTIASNDGNRLTFYLYDVYDNFLTLHVFPKQDTMWVAAMEHKAVRDEIFKIEIYD